MKYQNRKTGNVIDVKSIFSGEDWEPVAAPNPHAVAPVQPKGRKKKAAAESEDGEE